MIEGVVEVKSTKEETDDRINGSKRRLEEFMALTEIWVKFLLVRLRIRNSRT